MMKEGVDFNIRFVQIVEKQKCLYDNTHSDYTNKAKTEGAWKEISREVGEPDHLCKERWRNIRCSFLRYVREKSLGGPRFKKPYYLANHLQFVQPFLSFNMRTTGVQESDYDPSETFESNYLPDVGENTQIEATMIGIKEHKSQIENPLKSERKKAKFKKRKRNLARLDDQLEDIALRYYQTKTVQMEEEGDSSTKADSMFLQSLLPDFQCMSPCGKRRVKIAIMKIIDDELKAQSGASGARHGYL